LRDYTDCKITISIAELYAIHKKDLKTRLQDFGRILRNRVLPGALIGPKTTSRRCAGAPCSPASGRRR